MNKNITGKYEFKKILLMYKKQRCDWKRLIININSVFTRANLCPGSFTNLELVANVDNTLRIKLSER